MTLLGAAHSLASNPSAPDAHRLAESAARNAALLARLVQDLQRIAHRGTARPRREMIEVMPALRASIGAGNVRIDGDEKLIAIAALSDLTAFVDALAAAPGGCTHWVHAREEGPAIQISFRPAFPDRPLDAGLIRSLAAPLGPVAIGVDGSVTLSIPALNQEPAAVDAGARWRAN